MCWLHIANDFNFSSLDLDLYEVLAISLEIGLLLPGTLMESYEVWATSLGIGSLRPWPNVTIWSMGYAPGP